MKKSHAGFWVGLAVLFTAAIYSVVLFLLKPVMDVSAWMLYGFTMAAFVLLGSQLQAIVRPNAQIALDTAMGIVTLIYFALQFVFGGLICMAFDGLPLMPVVVCETLLLAAYLILTFAVFGAQSDSAAQNRNERDAVRKMRMLEEDVKSLAEAQRDPEKKRLLLALAEDIHYSDVMMPQGLDHAEGHVAQSIAALQVAACDEDADLEAYAEVVRRRLRERDRKSAILKR